MYISPEFLYATDHHQFMQVYGVSHESKNITCKMSKNNPLAGLIGNYEDSDEEYDEKVSPAAIVQPEPGATKIAPPVSAAPGSAASHMLPAVHPPPITHCLWSACYDESSGFTYYWNQQTNAVTWEAPPEYLLALKLAQQQLHSAGSTEVSAEEWQLYQQALAEKQNSQAKSTVKSVASNSKPTANKTEKVIDNNKNKKLGNKKRPASEDEDEKIELITSYYHSDSESNDESESPAKPSMAPKPLTKLPKNPNKKQKTKPAVVQYGPSLPANQEYTVPIGPDLPPALVIANRPKTPEIMIEKPVTAKEQEKKKVSDNEDSQDESSLLIKLKDKAKLLEKLGGEIPTELQKIIQDEIRSQTASPAPSVEDTNKDIKPLETNIDDLLEEIEKKELPKVVKLKEKIDIFSEDNKLKSTETSAQNSPRSSGTRTPPIEEFKLLFPSSQTIIEEPEKPVSLFPSAVNIQENGIDTKPKSETPPITVPEKKVGNVYLMDTNEHIGNAGRKKLRISHSVLPEKKKSDVPAYTTKYSQFIEGFSSERTGLGFSKEEDSVNSPKNTISYGNGLSFTKGETLNEDRKDEALDDLTDLVEAKLKYLNQLQPCMVTPVQEMLIQMQTLVSAFRAGSLAVSYWRRWADAAALSLSQHEASAAPPGWTCSFQRSEGRYRYRRSSDGLQQWEYPAVADTDMEICTTPPPPPLAADGKEELTNPPLPPLPPPSAPPAPHAPPVPSAPPSPAPPPPPLECWARSATPPPPAWVDPPPPGCDDHLPPLPPEPLKQEIGDELMSFYNDIAELEKQTTGSPAAPSSPETAPAAPSALPAAPAPPRHKEKLKDKDGDRDNKEAKNKKKSKVKISSSIGMKQKSVSTMVAKWQQVADEIHSD